MSDIKTKMWKELSDSPFLMIGLSTSGEHREPMTAQLDKDAQGEFWIYTTKTNRIASGGPAMAQFAAKGHDLFACIKGTLVVENDPAVIDRYWSNAVESWYEHGRNDPTLQMMRFELDDAEIWTAEAGIGGAFKLMTGKKVDPEEMGEHAVEQL